MSYSTIPTLPLGQNVTYHRPESTTLSRVRLDDSALSVMTDLTKVTAVTIAPGTSMNVAAQRMRQRGVRMLLVVENDVIVGLITATDLQSEKPMQFIQRYGGTRNDIMVRDIMTPAAKLEVLCFDDVERAQVGNIVATLEAAGRQHALVVDRLQGNGPQQLRGIFSAAQIARQLDTDLFTQEIAHSFADIESVVMSN